MAISIDEAALVEQYTPLMVLYPEIQQGTIRERHKDFPFEAPLAKDYHPRDIRIVLEYSGFHRRCTPWKDKPVGWDRRLDRMDKDRYEKDLDLVPGVKAKKRDKFWSAYAEIPKDRKEFQKACYARVIHGKATHCDRFLVQYWYPYFYNDFWNTHEMDWEVVMIVFKETKSGPQPVVCACSAHLGGHWLTWPDVEKANERKEPAPDGTHPIVYVANGSHANYFYGSGRYATAPPTIMMAAELLEKLLSQRSNNLLKKLLTNLLKKLLSQMPTKSRPLVDYTTSLKYGERCLVEARLIPPAEEGLWSGDWRWLNQKGRWGSPGKLLDLEFGDSGSYGPPQSGDRWDYPFRWVDTACQRAPSREESRIPTLLELNA